MDAVFQVSFFDTWMWLIFVGVGLVLIILELFVGIDTGLDMVFVGTALVLGGVLTLWAKYWIWTVVAAGVICLLYLFIGRRFIHKRMAVKESRTNIDTIVGKTGVVQEAILPDKNGTVKVGYETWRARAGSSIPAGEEIIVLGVRGVTLEVARKTERSVD